MATALLNSGHIAEPGTGVFAASAPGRGDVETITRKIIDSGVDIILSGGEVLLLPEDEIGHFGYSGLRGDGLNLIERARERGYQVVFT
ncbi:MAG: alkaline phosphatase, partial [Gemmatimonadota bacterium]